MKDIVLDVSLRLKGPVVVGASSAGEFGIDLPFARTGNDQYCLPGSHVKGRLRESLQSLGYSSDFLTKWLGNESRNYMPQRGRMVFSDFAVEQENQGKIRMRIEMDSERQAVKKGAYLVIESPFDSGEQIKFKGKIQFYSISGEESKEIEEAISYGLRCISAFGGNRSVGFGRLLWVDIEKQERIVSTENVEEKPGGMSLSLILRPESEFCLAKPKNSDNLFQSEEIISGGTIKGCLANTLNNILGRELNSPIDDSLPAPWTELGRNLDKIRFDHAFPSSRGNRPRYYPLSLVRAAKSKESHEKGTFDLIFRSGPGLINDTAPTFSIDWKGDDFQEVDSLFGWDNTLERILRVRTAMDTSTRRAKEGQLFAYEMINPKDVCWYSRADLSKVPETERGKVRAQLEKIFGIGLKYLGKTKASVQVEVQLNEENAAPEPLCTQDQVACWVITLQTPALMLEPDPKLNYSLVDKGILFKAFQEYWQGISNSCLQLKQFFAQQRLLGGYLQHRFQAHLPYNPFLLTTEKSVFLLESTEGSPWTESKKLIQQWSFQGLPLPEWTSKYGLRQGEKSDWHVCPFVPENGFGEVCINMDCHESFNPSTSYQEI